MAYRNDFIGVIFRHSPIIAKNQQVNELRRCIYSLVGGSCVSMTDVISSKSMAIS